MGVRQISGYVAHALLAVYWCWMLVATAPEMRRSTRPRTVQVRVLALRTAAVALTALVVGVIHFWATQWWQVLASVLVAAPIGVLLRRDHRRVVAAPRHRLSLGGRARRLDHRHRATVPEPEPPAAGGPG
ncbi:MAG: hypothetical protein OJJ54_21795 [Pseudonocardia sp.]|nr:hypothetical protein [Pseudonocardia sp.]